MKKLLCVCYVCSVSMDCTGFSFSVKDWRHEFSSSFFYFFVLVLFNLAIVNIAVQMLGPILEVLEPV